MAKGKLSRFELNYIKAIARHVTVRELARRMGRTPRAIKRALIQVDARTIECRQRMWMPAEVEYLTKHYPSDGAKRVARALDRTPLAVRMKANSMRIVRVSLWSEDDVATLREHYAPRGARYVAEQLGRPVPHVKAAAYRYGVAAPRD